MMSPNPSEEPTSGDARNKESAERDTAALVEYFRTFGEPDPVQPAGKAWSDPQIKNIHLVITGEIHRSSAGTIVDVGCGDGILLQRLSDTPYFRDRGWTYYATDVPERVKTILHRAVDLDLMTKVSGAPLERFYKNWVPSQVPRPLLVVIRNVFHELGIQDTANLLYLLRCNLDPQDTLVVQDLRVLSNGEKGNACWYPPIFEDLLRELGFVGYGGTEATTRGNGWFTLVLHLEDQVDLRVDEVLRRVVEARKRQLEVWRSFDRLMEEDSRPANLALADFELQRGALLNQLHEAAPAEIDAPSEGEQEKLVNLAFRKQLEAFDVATFAAHPTPVPAPPHFRDRGQNQERLEEFLRGEAALAVVRGGTLMGKTDLVREVLAHRAHSRAVVQIDVQHTSTIWNLIEQYLGEVGCRLHYEIATSFTGVDYASIRSPVSEFIKKLAEYTVVVLDHTERLADFNGVILDADIRDFLADLAAGANAKVILTAQRVVDVGFMPQDVTHAPEQPLVNRLPEEHYVRHILDDYVDRSKLNVEQYPSSLIEAIDRHPYLAVLAGRILQAEGNGALQDPDLLILLRNKLRTQLLLRIVDDASKPALDLFSALRIPVPKELLEGLVSPESVQSAVDSGLVYAVSDRNHRELLTVIGVLRNTGMSTGGVSPVDASPEHLKQLDRRHIAIAEAYTRIFRKDSDPRWLRESHFHALAGGDVGTLRDFGRIYSREIAWAGEYWFSTRRDFAAALWAFQTARSMGVQSYDLERRLAACEMRAGKVEEGEALYEELIARYPRSRGPKTSYIDSVLFLREYQKALNKLTEFGLQPGDDSWVAHEYGRAYLGLERYEDAIRAFEIEIKLKPVPIAYTMLARAYRRRGDRESVGRVLADGVRRFRTDRHLLLAQAAHQIGSGGAENLARAEPILRDLHRRFPSSGDVLQQLVKWLFLVGRGDEAEQVIASVRHDIYPERYRLPIEVYVLFARDRWEEAIRRLSGAPVDNVHLAGLKKQAYLRWAQSLPELEESAGIARLGLLEPLHPSVARNLPILVTSARLAQLAGDADEYSRLLSVIEALNPEISSMLREEGDVTYWEEPTDE